MKRRKSSFAGLLGHAARTVLLLGLMATAAAASAQTKVKFGLIGTNESQLPVIIALDKGLFKAENIDIETVTFQGGGIAVQALAGGSIDLSILATDHVLRLHNRGIDARFLIGIDRYITHILIVPSGKAYKGIQDLRGKTIAVTAPGSYSDNVLRSSIRDLGLNPDKDFTIVSADGTSGRAGLESGKIDALMTATPDQINDDLQTPGKYRILYDWRTIPHSGQAIVAKKDWIDKNFAAAQGIARAVLKAEQIIQTDPATTQHAIKKLFPERSDEFARQFAAVAPKLFLGDGKISEPGLKKMIEIVRVIDPDLKPVTLADVDLTDKLLGR